jgi:hypothetical protein
VSESNRIPADPHSLLMLYRQTLIELQSKLGKAGEARALVDRALSVPMIKPVEGEFMVSNGYGQNSGKGFVAIQVPEQQMQIDPDTARNLALNLLGAAEAADQEAMLIQFLIGQVGMSLADVGPLLAALRHARGIVGNQGGGEG